MSALDDAVSATTAAFRAYRTLPRERIAGFLTAIGEAITGLGDDLITTASAETSLPAARITGERGRTVGQQARHFYVKCFAHNLLMRCQR